MNHCLNPYSNGILTDSCLFNSLRKVNVLILILMEYSLTNRFTMKTGGELVLILILMEYSLTCENGIDGTPSFTS